MFIIQAPSAYRLGYLCLIGQGQTEAEAWAEAYGPDWKVTAKKLIKRSGAFCSEVTDEEWQEMQYHN